MPIPQVMHNNAALRLLGAFAEQTHQAPQLLNLPPSSPDLQPSAIMQGLQAPLQRRLRLPCCRSNGTANSRKLYRNLTKAMHQFAAMVGTDDDVPAPFKPPPCSLCLQPPHHTLMQSTTTA
jgi:hypothetical protein